MKAKSAGHRTFETSLPRLLESFYQNQRPFDRIALDPIAFPHRYEKAADIEVVAFIAATMAYGRVSGFQGTIEKILALCDGQPYRYLISFQPERERPRFGGIYYRFTRSEDLFSLLYLMSRILRKEGSLAALFTRFYRKEDEDIGPGLSRFIAALHADLRQIEGREMTRGLRHLLPSPKTGSACKRLNLFLRWMVRPKDGLDFGLWKDIPAANLIIPLDTHIARISRYLGLTRRKTADWKMAKEITLGLQKIDPIDPLKFDFALCHLGMSGDCPVDQKRAKCALCPLNSACSRGRGFF